jgi:phytoene dehydrogenase-like protein
VDEYDVIVIGAGISGLGVSALLAQAGKKVLTLERAKVIGGRAHSYRQLGHITNTGGPRAGLENGRVDELFEKVGKEPGERGFFDGILHFRDGGFMSLPDLVSETPPDQAVALFGALDSVSDDDLPRLDNISAREWITGLVDDQNLIDICRLSSIVMSTLPRLESIAASTMVESVRLVMGFPRIFLAAHGYGDFMRILAEASQESGGEIRSRSRVSRINIDQGAAKGVVITHRDGTDERIDAPVVVTAFPIWDLFDVADEGAFVPEFVEKVRHVGRRTALFGLTASLREPLYSGKEFILTDAVRAEHPFAGFMASNVAPSLSPEGEHLFEACCQCDIELGDNPVELEKRLDLLRQDIDDMFPGWEDNANWITTSFRWEEPARNPGREGVNRPGAVAPGIAGLYFAGDTVSSRSLPGLECAADSAMICAEAVLTR